MYERVFELYYEHGMLENVLLDRNGAEIEKSYKKLITQLERTEESPMRTRGSVSADTKLAEARMSLKAVQQSLGRSPKWLLKWYKTPGDTSGFTQTDMWLQTFANGQWGIPAALKMAVARRLMMDGRDDNWLGRWMDAEKERAYKADRRTLLVLGCGSGSR